MDFFKVGMKSGKGGRLEVYPEFRTVRTKDLMVQGGKFYAIWDEEKGLWSKDSYRVNELADAELYAKAKEIGPGADVKSMEIMDSGYRKKFLDLCKLVDDNYRQLDQNLVWANTQAKREDYASKRLPYPLEDGDHSAWDELMSRLYAPEERAKLEWAIGAVVSGDSKKIQKCIVIFGKGGNGKSTVLNIIQDMFDGYCTTFRGADMGDRNNAFSMAPFESFPLVAIDHDTDLSRITDNSKLNSVIAHEDIIINQKYKLAYSARSNAMLFMATNSPVAITDQNSGLIRRLIDVEPTGDTFPPAHYEALMKRIKFEHGAIATHCLDVYKTLGPNYFREYTPTKMMFRTNVFYNYVEANYDIFRGQSVTTLEQAWALYKEYCIANNNERALPRHKMREELKAYFEEFHERKSIDGVSMRNVYLGFKMPGVFKAVDKDDGNYELVLDRTESLFDEKYSDYPAQYATEEDTPKAAWTRVKTTLADIDTRQVHFVKVPEQHIVIDFDIRGPRGGKDLDRNLEEASLWPPTYAEISKSGGGVHLHYIYEGDVSQLDQNFNEGVEVKVYRGGASLRRKLTKCNALPVAVLNSGLPTKEKKVLASNTLKSEKALRDLIERNLRKEIHPGTKPSIDFIKKILDDEYEKGTFAYDVSDMQPRLIAFANNSTNKALECIKLVQKMKFKSENSAAETLAEVKDDRLAFYDVEVYPNLFVVCWKFEDDPIVTRMINPTPQEVEGLFQLKLVGFNNRRYDNHILWARFMGYSNMDLFKLSQKIIANNRSAMFGEAYNLSYADVWDFSSKKDSLKKFGIELKMHHMEMNIPWDQDVPDYMIDKVVEYCVNDVLLTEAVKKAREQDYIARQILSELSGLSVNNSTQQHTAKIIFGDDKDAAKQFVYTDLSEMFPGYSYDAGVSTYRGEVVGEGGYVYAETGIYENVALLDVASMHPTSIELLNLFGKYTENYSALKQARLAIKHKDYDTAKVMLGGKLGPYLNDPEQAEALSYALKIVINIVYGLTSAKFDNPFLDRRNVDNIVAKRGALFMIDLKNHLQDNNYKVVHIKTDSVKIADADGEAVELVQKFGEAYGYDFELEGVYKKLALVNDAVYVARDETDKWTAVGAQFQHPYVFKMLFSGETPTFDDYCETRSVMQGAMYLDFEYDRPMPLYTGLESMVFVGKTGRFVPVKEDGGKLWRVKDDKFFAVTGTKDYLWMEASQVDKDNIDMSYFEHLLDEAVKTIEKFGSFEELFE